MSHPIPGHDYGEKTHPSDSPHKDSIHYSVKQRKHEVAKKMSPLGKLKAMLDDKPTNIAEHLAWFKKHGVPRNTRTF